MRPALVPISLVCWAVIFNLITLLVKGEFVNACHQEHKVT